MANLEAVLFDWAGTMVDFGSCAPVVAMSRVFHAEGVTLNEPIIRRFMGMAKREHVVAILSEQDIGALWRAEKGADWNEHDVDRIMAALEPAMQDAATEHSQLIPGAATAVSALRRRGVRIGSTTGYTRTMMQGILPAAAAQGYAPDVTVCAGETVQGRPAPLMLWAAMGQMSAWPAGRCVAVDDAPVGIEAGRNAGLWTIGVVASGNGLGLNRETWAAVGAVEQAARLAPVIETFRQAGADFVIPSVADLELAVQAIEVSIDAGASPGSAQTVALGCPGS